MDTHEPGSPAGVRSPRATSPGSWNAARSTRWGGAPGRAADRQGRRPTGGRERRHLLGGMLPGGPAATRSPVAELGSAGAFPAFPWRQVSPTWLLVGLILAFLSGEALQLLTGFRLGAWRERWLLGASGAAATAAAIVAAASTGRASAAWRCFAAGCALWAVGAMARALPMESWRLGPLLGGAVRSATDPLLLADLGFLGLVPLFLGAVALAL